ncbi:GntR family transcriptional regulator [Jiella mangrovi]|uniref:GntR family transcriptional regulator n=1 Tax=Jiella mangrovi TaxID=2821407 RepID=A0ABS4BL49_9HYPH|nr:GntR family transcriptional regulator [Jiella mangrovi]MBP0617462.1 GntR family transcriptional regulator [Jiella mangrovi]
MVSPITLAERSQSQTTKALLALRDLLLSGQIAPGERLSELPLVERLGVSRTPVRAALAQLASEGFLERLAGGGYQVKPITEEDIFDAIEVRGTLEGLAAAKAARRVSKGADIAPLRSALARIEDVLAEPSLDLDRYITANGAFHTGLWELAGSTVLSREIERANALPFAGHNSFVEAQGTLSEARAILTIGQDQHRQIVEAIAEGDGQRAESAAREHARLAIRNLRLATATSRALEDLPGASLIVRGDTNAG